MCHTKPPPFRFWPSLDMCQSSPLNEMCSESLGNLPTNVTKKLHVWPCLPKISHTDTVCHFDIYSKILFQLLQKWSKSVHWSCFEVKTTIASRSKKSAVFIILSLATRRCMFKTPFNDIYEHCLCIRSINTDAKMTGQSDFAEWESGLVSSIHLTHFKRQGHKYSLACMNN